MADIIIRNGTIIDGTGKASFVGDVAVKDGRILEVGFGLAVTGTREFDATGKIITPGWVDPHTHYDAQIMWDPMVSPSSANGVTTVVMGNCAVGLAPCPKPLRGFVTDLCDSVEDIPADSINEAVSWEWETFPEYMAAMDKKSFACDIGILVGHAAVRTWVLGAKANASDRPNGQMDLPLTKQEISSMGKVVEEAVAAGALGFSSSRVSLHRDPSGVLLPGSLASHEELLEMGDGVVRGGGGVFELASTFDLYDDYAVRGAPEQDALQKYYHGEWRWLKQMATKPGLSVTTGGGPNADYMRSAQQVRDQGGDLMITPMMRLGTHFMSLKSSIHPLLASPSFRALQKKVGAGTPEMLAEMQHPAVRSSIIDECKTAKRSYVTNLVDGDMCDKVWAWSLKDQERTVEESFRRHSRPWDAAYDVLAHPEDPFHHGILIRALYNYDSHSLEPLREMFLHEMCVSGFADGGAHMKLQCEATTPTTMLSFWCRDRTRGEKLPLELVVKKQTADSARMMGLSDRGELVPGMRADVNVIDMNRLDVQPPEFVTDLPLGAGRWVQDVTGYDLTLCAGVATFENGVPTGALPGRVAKNPLSTGRIANGLRGSVPAGSVEGATNARDLKEVALRLASGASGSSAVMKTLNDTQSTISKARL